MKRLTEKNINTGEHFDEVFTEGKDFDVERQVEFYKLIQQGMKVLDLGAGIKGFVELFRESGGKDNVAELHALDFSEYAKREVVNKYPDIQYAIGNVLETPYEDGYFDLVGAGELIEHMEKPEYLVKEMARITKQGGMMIISTVDPDCEDSKGKEYPEHIWQFTPEDLINLFKPYGEPQYRRVRNYDCIFCRR